MTATTTTTNLRTGEQGTAPRVRRLALAAGSFLAAIGSGWNAFVEGGQLGSDAERSISRDTGARI